MSDEETQGVAVVAAELHGLVSESEQLADELRDAAASYGEVDSEKLDRLQDLLAEAISEIGRVRAVAEIE